MDKVFEVVTSLFNYLIEFWESPRVQRWLSAILVVAFIGALVLIGMNRAGMLPPAWAEKVPTNHFYAVNLAFTLVLIMEVAGLIFTFSCSVSKSLGKQLEILALILLRSAFKELSHFPEPIALGDDFHPLYNIISDGLGAFLIFLLLGIYYKVQTWTPVIKDGVSKFRFVGMKKMVGLALLLTFVAVGVVDLRLKFAGEPGFDFFETFYTILIFSDILMVLISQGYLPTFHAVFRNSGFALATLLMRLALTAPPIFDALIGVGAAVFALGLTLVYNAFYRSYDEIPEERGIGHESKE